MATLRVDYLTKRPRRDGSCRYFWQPSTSLRKKGWKLERLPDDYAQAVARAQEINAEVDKWRAGEAAGPAALQAPGTMAALYAHYTASREYRELAAKTRKLYASCWNNTLRDWCHDVPAKALTAKSCKTLYDSLRDDRPAWASNVIRFLRRLLSFGEDEGFLPKGSNPARNPGIAYKARRQVIWTEEAVDHFIATADRMGHFGVGTAVRINEWCGQRKEDILRCTCDQYRDGRLHIQHGLGAGAQQKTGAEVVLPVDMIPAVRERIAQQLARNARHGDKGANTIIQDEQGRRYLGDWFAHVSKQIRDEAIKTMPEMKGMVFKNLRHTAVTRLAENGATTEQIVSVTGHTLASAKQILETYLIRTVKAAEEAFEKRLQKQANSNQPTETKGNTDVNERTA
jgi:integrase